MTLHPGLSAEASGFISGAHHLLIDGQWVAPQAGRRFEVFDPATGAVVATAPEAQAADVDLAVAAARRALDGPWARMTGPERARLLLRLAELIEANVERLALLETRGAEPLPFIGDDLLASFDDARAARALDLLAATHPDQQTILFTHHAHVAALARARSGGLIEVIEL